jgi:hypothetical protein
MSTALCCSCCSKSCHMVLIWLGSDVQVCILYNHVFKQHVILFCLYRGRAGTNFKTFLKPRIWQFRTLVLFSVIVEDMINSFLSTEKLFVTIMARIGINLQVYFFNVIVNSISSGIGHIRTQ